jgi:serine/threonine-protein kinase
MFVKRLKREGDIYRALRHPNIIQLLDASYEGFPFLALEYIHGKDLRAIFDRCRASGENMPIAQACFIIMKVCEGLDYAHNKRDATGRELGLVHRDVSPQNVLISYEGEVKLIDFGIAKAAGKAETQADPGQVRLHVARAGARPADRSAQRHLRGRHRALRALDG